jgi:protein DJ-1
LYTFTKEAHAKYLRYHVVDVLRRAKIDVTVLGVGIKNEVALCSRGVKIAADIKFEEHTVKAVSF